jgi:hypothetical protein
VDPIVTCDRGDEAGLACPPRRRAAARTGVAVAHEDQHAHDCDCDDHGASVETKQLEHGFVIVPVLDTEPPWAFTVGLARTAQHPEISISGLSQHFAAYLLNALGHSVVDGRTLEPGDLLEDVIRGHRLRVREVPRNSYDDRFGAATRFHGGTNYRMLQLVWNDTDGRFPDETAPAGVQELL